MERSHHNKFKQIDYILEAFINISYRSNIHSVFNFTVSTFWYIFKIDIKTILIVWIKSVAELNYIMRLHAHSYSKNRIHKLSSIL